MLISQDEYKLPDHPIIAFTEYHPEVPDASGSEIKRVTDVIEALKVSKSRVLAASLRKEVYDMPVLELTYTAVMQCGVLAQEYVLPRQLRVECWVYAQEQLHPKIFQLSSPNTLAGVVLKAVAYAHMSDDRPANKIMIGLPAALKRIAKYHFEAIDKAVAEQYSLRH